MTYDSISKGERVKWHHHDRRGTKRFAGVVTGQTADGKPYMLVRRDDTNKIVRVRTTALQKETP